MNDWDEGNVRFVGAMAILVIVWLLLYFLFVPIAHAADNIVNVDQVGNSNLINITQSDTFGHVANIAVGTSINNTFIGGMGTVNSTPAGDGSDANSITLLQQGLGAKTATVEITGGYNNGVYINQDGTGNHVTSILNLNGSANSISVSQSGASNNTFTVQGGNGTTNNGNTVNATQSGNAGADKSFTLNLNGTSGANVTVQQTNPTQSNAGSMSINCLTGYCGSYSYIRN
jgi:hypothetical protein